jgi:hypothetical protein
MAIAVPAPTCCTNWVVTRQRTTARTLAPDNTWKI